MKISFVGHSHHQLTRSSEFFVDILRRVGSVERFWDETWRGEQIRGIPPAIEQADLIVVWQSVRYAQLLARRGHRNIVYVPMYDAARKLRRSFWTELKDIKILNFSSTLHQRVQSLGAPRSAYFQYFPDPAAHRTVTDFATLRAFFWQRQERPSWQHIRRLLGTARFDAVHLHLAMDPNCSAPPEPSAQERQTLAMEVTHWLPNRNDLLVKLASSNVYFAPRLYEGIGLAFLEAMAMGMAVCAYDSPTHNEYIVDGVNGFLYRLGEKRPPDWSKAATIGPRARESVEKGYRRWQTDQPRLIDFLTDPSPGLATQRYAGAAARGAAPIGRAAETRSEERSEGNRSIAREGGRSLVATEAAQAQPLVTVATVVLNAPEELAQTLESVVTQNYAAKEILVIDGGSADATRRVIDRYEDRIDYWCSQADRGPYDAMNKAADQARGRWILYINAGDSFVDDEALARLMSGVPDDADVIAAHHIYLAPDGAEEIHRCVDFERTYRQLLAGETDGGWLGGIPGHQSLLTRVALVRQHRYDLAFKIAADHEFLYRMRQQGAAFHIEPVILSQYVGGGLSWTHLLLCLAEWRSIALRYSQHPERVKQHFHRLKVNTFRFARRMEKFDWRRDPARSHPWLSLAAEAEFRLWSLLDRADALYARLRLR